MLQLILISVLTIMLNVNVIVSMTEVLAVDHFPTFEKWHKADILQGQLFPSIRSENEYEKNDWNEIRGCL